MDEKEETDKVIDEARLVMVLTTVQVKELSISHELLLKALDELADRVDGLARFAREIKMVSSAEVEALAMRVETIAARTKGGKVSSRSPDISLLSSDRCFGISLSDDVIAELVRYCSDAYPLETGGILLGHYNQNRDLAIVFKASPPPSDSKSGKRWFYRGVNGLQNLIDKLWGQKNFYLGEWHLHPNGSPTASADDIKAISHIAITEQYHCPEPVLLIIGGAPGAGWIVQGYVSKFGRELVELGNKKLSS